MHPSCAMPRENIFRERVRKPASRTLEKKKKQPEPETTKDKEHRSIARASEIELQRKLTQLEEAIEYS